MPQVYSPEWCKLPYEARQKLHEVFGLKKSGVSHVFSGKIISDGHNETDLQGITLEKMQQFVGNEEQDFFKLWELVKEKAIKGEEAPVEPVQEISLEELVKPYVEPEKPVESIVEPQKVEPAVIGEVEKPKEAKKSK